MQWNEKMITCSKNQLSYMKKPEELKGKKKKNEYGQKCSIWSYEQHFLLHAEWVRSSKTSFLANFCRLVPICDSKGTCLLFFFSIPTSLWVGESNGTQGVFFYLGQMYNPVPWRIAQIY